MAKVKRSVLKEIVKECLLEILFEGIDSEPGYEDQEPMREARTKRRAPRPSKRDLAAAVKEENPRQKRPQRLQETAVDAAVSELTSNPLMASVFADTAQTTLLTQKEGRRPPVDTAAAAVDSVTDMENLFEGAGNWAAIAFNEVDK